MKKPENIYYKASIQYESEGDLLTQILYITEGPVWKYFSEAEGDVYDEDDKWYWIFDENGKDVYIGDGNRYFMEAMSHVMLLKNIKSEKYEVKNELIDWSELPELYQKRVDVYRWLSEHPIKFYEYPESKFIEVHRSEVPDRIPVERWLFNNSQPFDLIFEYTDNVDEAFGKHKNDNGLYLKTMYKACPVCDSKNIENTPYNNLCPEMLAGSSGTDDVCQDCGYHYRNIEVMS